MLKSWYIIFFQCPYLPEIFFRSFDLLIFDAMFKDLSHPVDAEIIEAYKYAWRKPGLTNAPLIPGTSFIVISRVLLDRIEGLLNPDWNQTWWIGLWLTIQSKSDCGFELPIQFYHFNPNPFYIDIKNSQYIMQSLDLDWIDNPKKWIEQFLVMSRLDLRLTSAWVWTLRRCRMILLLTGFNMP